MVPAMSLPPLRDPKQRPDFLQDKLRIVFFGSLLAVPVLVLVVFLLDRFG